MKRLVVNVIAFVIIGIGGLYLSVPAASASSYTAEVIKSCPSQFKMSCINDGVAWICCTGCEATGEFGECIVIN